MLLPPFTLVPYGTGLALCGNYATLDNKHAFQTERQLCFHRGMLWVWYKIDIATTVYRTSQELCPLVEDFVARSRYLRQG